MQTTTTNPIAMKINEIVNEEVNRLMEEKYKRYSLLEEVYQDITNLSTFKKLLINEEKKSEPEKLVKNVNNESNFMLVILDRLSSMQLQLNAINKTLKNTKPSCSENIRLEIVEKEHDELAIAKEDKVIEEEESEEEESEEEEEESEVEEESEEETQEEEEEETSSVETETEETKEEEQEEELFEVELNGKTYCTDNEQNGKIYELVDDEIGKQVGYFKNGKSYFIKKI